jgi:hypothetical protein
MEGNYNIDINIGRDDARRFLAELATNDKLRMEVEEDPVGVLAGRGINVPRELLPDVVTLPSKKEIVHILYAADSLLDETASPFGLLVVFVFGAMPVIGGRSPGGDGAG